MVVADKLKMARFSSRLSRVEDLRLGDCGCEGAAEFRAGDFAGLVKSTIPVGASTSPIIGFEGDRHSSLG